MKLTVSLSIVFLFFFSTAFADTFSSFMINEHAVMLHVNPEDKIEVSVGCDQTHLCDAWKAAHVVSHKNLKPELFRGGKNPGSVFCTYSVHGEVLMAQNSNGDLQTLCHFKDGSLISAVSLMARARLNDKPQKK